ncbi:MAG TPA: hypothetical protein VGJ28_05405 [Micromonosporaceae bacterium]|jgi:hypothetical protein
MTISGSTGSDDPNAAALDPTPVRTDGGSPEGNRPAATGTAPSWRIVGTQVCGLLAALIAWLGFGLVRTAVLALLLPIIVLTVREWRSADENHRTAMVMLSVSAVILASLMLIRTYGGGPRAASTAPIGQPQA